MILIKRQIPDVIVSTEEVGQAVAMANDAAQREFLLAFTATVEAYETPGSWPMQCRAIIDGYSQESGLSQDERNRIVSVLQDLVDHLNEPVAEGGAE